jgi:hypothetical protein
MSDRYVKLYVEWLLTSSVRDQFDSFARGFRAVGGPTLSIFRAEELELLICGSHSVNIDELESATTCVLDSLLFVSHFFFFV